MLVDFAVFILSFVVHIIREYSVQNLMVTSSVVLANTKKDTLIQKKQKSVDTILVYSVP